MAEDNSVANRGSLRLLTTRVARTVSASLKVERKAVHVVAPYPAVAMPVGHFRLSAELSRLNRTTAAHFRHFPI